MRRPRFRLNTRRLMALVVVVAMLLTWLVNRPYPVSEFASGELFVIWSDGTSTVEHGPKIMTFSGTSWFQIVGWPDGRHSFYLTIR